MSELRQIVLSVFSGVVSSCIYGIILVLWGFVSNGNELSMDSFLMVIINNWFVLLIIFIVIFVIIFQRLRMIEKWNGILPTTMLSDSIASVFSVNH